MRSWRNSPQWTARRRYLRVRIADCRRWATDRGGSQRRDHSGARGRQYDGHQYLPLADGAERGEAAPRVQSRQVRSSPSRLRTWSRDERRGPRQVRLQWTNWEAPRSRSAVSPRRYSPRRHNKSPCRRPGRSPKRRRSQANRPPRSSSPTTAVRRPGRQHRHRWFSRRQRRGSSPSSRQFRLDAEFLFEPGKSGQFDHDLRNRRRCAESSWNNRWIWPIAASLPTLTLPVSVALGGTNAMVLYAGSAPTLESGYVQINVALPSGLHASSAANLVLTIGGSSVTVPIYIQ